MAFGKNIGKAFGSIGKKITSVGNLGKKISENVVKVTSPLKQGLNIAMAAGLGDAVRTIPLVGDAAALGLRGLQTGVNAADKLARRGSKLSDRVSKYGGAVRDQNFQQLGNLTQEDKNKHNAAIERKEIARNFDELPGYDDDLFH